MGPACSGEMGLHDHVMAGSDGLLGPIAAPGFRKGDVHVN
jgi:hypothetical protein